MNEEVEVLEIEGFEDKNEVEILTVEEKKKGIFTRGQKIFIVIALIIIVLGLFFKTLKRKKQITGLCLVSIHIMFLFYDFFYLNTGNIIPYSLFGGH